MRVVQERIINELHVSPSINPIREFDKRVKFVKDYMIQAKVEVLVLGISGGQDSTLTGFICQAAINQLRIETSDNSYQFIAMRLPYLVQKDEEDAQTALTYINPDKILIFNIAGPVDAFEKEFALCAGKPITDYNKGNVKARMRMLAQYAIGAMAQNVGGLVVGTDHAAEAVTGFFTKYGDGAVDITPITGLNKRQGKELLKFLDAPEKLYLKVPTADLLDDNSGQPDETELGITYDQLDDYLEGKDVGDEIATKIENRYIITNHKRNQPVNPYDI